MLFISGGYENNIKGQERWSYNKNNTLRKLSKGTKEKVHDLLHTFQNKENTDGKSQLMKWLIQTSFSEMFTCKYRQTVYFGQEMRQPKIFISHNLLHKGISKER